MRKGLLVRGGCYFSTGVLMCSALDSAGAHCPRPPSLEVACRLFTNHASLGTGWLLTTGACERSRSVAAASLRAAAWASFAIDCIQLIGSNQVMLLALFASLSRRAIAWSLIGLEQQQRSPLFLLFRSPDA